VFGEVGGVYFNLGLWAVAIYPAWLVLRHFGASKSQVEEGEEVKVGQNVGSHDTSSVEGVQQVNIDAKHV
jgi:hypothetical protein